MTVVKSHEKKCKNHFRAATISHYNIVKCCRNVNFEEIDTEPSAEKMMDFDYCEEYLRSISNKILL